MKTNWVKVLILLGFALGSFSIFAQAPTARETAKLAESIDELVRQKPPGAAAVVTKEKRSKNDIAAVELEKVVPLAAAMLKIEESELREKLENDREKLSRIVFARLIAAKHNTSWMDLLAETPGKDLLPDAQAAGIPLKEIFSTLENLYVELSFAALDSPVHKPRKSKRSGG